MKKSEKKQQNEKNESIDRKFRAAYDGKFDEISAAIVVAVPPLGNIVSVNLEAEELTGYEARELKEMAFFNIFCDEDQQRIRSMFKVPQTKDQQIGKLFEHNVIVQKRSKRKIIVDMGFRLSHFEGKPVFIFTLQDITDLKNSEIRIRQANEYVNNILNSMKECVFVVDGNNKIKTVNDFALKLLEYTEDELSGAGINSLLVVSDSSKQNTKLLGTNTEFEAVLRSKSGKKLPVLASISALQLSTGQTPLYVMVAMDLTERKKAEGLIADQQMMLVQASKMSSLGIMASGIAHEINNPLHVIKGRCELLNLNEDSKDQPLIPASVHETATIINKMAVRIEKIVNGLKSFSRDYRETPLEQMSMADIIEETMLLCEKRLKNAGIDLTLPSAELKVNVMCRPTQISQVILNLLNNAHDAILETKDAARSERFIKLQVEDEGEYIEVSVTNGGKKISREISEKIFNPFFTTKLVGKGTGLGLSISKSIVESHGGNIYVDWKAPHTRFVVRLPKALKRPTKLAS